MNFWKDVPFSERVNIFDFSHIMYLVTVVVIVGLFIWKLDYIKTHWKIIRKVMIGISIVQVIVFYSWNVIELGFSLEAGLPLHVCRMSTFLGLYFLITEDKRVFHVLYYFSVFALIAIIYPVNVHPIYTHIIGWRYQISHIMILLVWIIGVFMYGYRPSFKNLNKVVIILFIVQLIIWRFNYLVGDGEYWYLRGDVNRPFFNDMHDLIWIGLLTLVSYIGMFLMTYVHREKGK